MEHYTIMLHGRAAVAAGYKFQRGACYRQVMAGGMPVGQLEVVVDDPGSYNGLENKWVSVAYIKTGEDVRRALDALRAAGFAGCPCIIERETVTGCFSRAEELCCMVI